VSRVGIYIKLQGELAEKFLALKRLRGLRNNSELVRELIVQAWRMEASGSGGDACEGVSGY